MQCSPPASFVCVDLLLAAEVFVREGSSGWLAQPVESSSITVSHRTSGGDFETGAASLKLSNPDQLIILSEAEVSQQEPVIYTTSQSKTHTFEGLIL